MATGARFVSGDFFLLQLRGLPGTARQYSLQAAGKEQDGISPHAQRQWAGDWTDVAGPPGELSAGRRIRADSEGAAAVYGRRRRDPATLKLLTADRKNRA